jgi:mono/diheme cytochrome c family protein
MIVYSGIAHSNSNEAVLMSRALRLSALAAICLLTLVACNDDPVDQTDQDAGADVNSADTVDEEPPTYHADIAPMIDENCAACHTADGIGPFDLMAYDKLKPLAPLALQEIEAGRMPPWMPDPECRDYRDERYLTDDEIATFKAWVDAGTPEGDPADAPEDTEDVTPEFNATHSSRIQEGYTPADDVVDDYRCFILDMEFDKTMYMKASRVVPDADNLVHHVLVYAIDESNTQMLRDADAAEEGPGYTCFGSPFPSSDSSDGERGQAALPNQIGAWVPGLLPDRTREDAGFRIEKGSSIVMQVHYNMLENSPEEDKTSFEMELVEEEPDYVNVTRPLAILDLDIPAGDSESIHTQTFTNYGGEPMVLEGVTGHMHVLGDRMSLRHLESGGQDACVLDIPKWDFDWQQSYKFPKGDLVEVGTGDSLELTCVYDNSPENQAVVDGERLTPRDVTWGEGTTDEMCLLYMRQIVPRAQYRPAPSEQCEYANECIENCDDPRSVECIYGCEKTASNCTLCEIEETVDCTRDACGVELLTAQDCLTRCITNSIMMEGSTADCMKTECADAYSGLESCVNPVFESGACDTGLVESCGLNLPQQ